MKDDPQGLHRSVFVMDNIHALRAVDSESVDLIYLDPPFNSNKEYSAPIGSKAAGAAFKDAWTLTDVDLADHNRLKREDPTLYTLIDASGKAHSDSMFSYLTMMAPRLVEMRRILKPTGSIWLHCDDTADAYLRLLMDSIFGSKAFRNAVTWKRQMSNNATTRRCGRIADTLLFYAFPKATWNGGYHALSDVQKARYKYAEPDGRRYKCENLTAPGSTLRDTWRGATPGPTRGWAHTRKKREEMWRSGLIATRRDGVPRLDGLKCYLEDSTGQKLQSIWTDIARVGNTSRERTDYPTQKPLALLERIIQASSNEGDLVLDPFCGCATTMVAAELLGRKWCGIDLSPLAVELVVQRIKAKRDLFSFQDVKARESVPIRTDIVRRMVRTKAERDRLKAIRFNEQEELCNICRHEFPIHMFELDHIMPKSKGGQDWEDNLQLLCSSCNRIKGDRTQEEARADVISAGRMNMDAFRQRDSKYQYTTPPEVPKAAEPRAPYNREN